MPLTLQRAPTSVRRFTSRISRSMMLVVRSADGESCRMYGSALFRSAFALE